MGALGLLPPIFLTFTPVPISLQTIGVLLAGGILGARLGAISQIVFLLLVAAGLPLLSGGRGGLECICRTKCRLFAILPYNSILLRDYSIPLQRSSGGYYSTHQLDCRYFPHLLVWNTCTSFRYEYRSVACGQDESCLLAWRYYQSDPSNASSRQIKEVSRFQQKITFHLKSTFLCSFFKKENSCADGYKFL